MIWFKACPRCQMGDITSGQDRYGRYVLCLQCGYLKDLEDSVGAGTVINKEHHQDEPLARTA